jgi:osmoprotectant transport system substrate-binding protein
MRNDHVDLVAEYVGSALRFAGVEDPPDDPTVAASLLGDRVAVYGIGVLAPSAAVDANVFVVSAETARNHDLESVSDLSGASLDRFGGPAECPDRPLCLVGLRDRYGVSFETFIAQPSLSFTAEALRRDEIDVGVMFSTSPELDAPDLVVLTDDRHLQAPENVLPMIRLPALERWGPGLERALDRVSEGLTTHELRRLNGQVADGGAVAEVARQWLDALERSSG